MLCHFVHFRSQFLNLEVHDKDELIDNKIKEEVGLLDVEAKIKEFEDRNKPPEEEIIDPKAKKAAKKEAPPPPKKEAPKKEAKKDAKKDTKKKGGEIKVEPVKDIPTGPPLEYHRSNYGVASFYLTDLLKPSVRAVKLKAPIVPVKKFQDLESKNLDLNTTAKKNIPEVMANSNFFDAQSFLIISLKLACAIGDN